MVLFGLLWRSARRGGCSARCSAWPRSRSAGMAIVEPYRFDRVTHFLDRTARPDRHRLPAVLGLSSLSSGGRFGVGLGARPGEVAGCRRRTATSSSPSSARSSACSAGSWCSCSARAGVRRAAGRPAHGRPVRPARRRRPPAWIVGQAMLNIGYVSLLPVTGVPLPLISAGGSALSSPSGARHVVLLRPARAGRAAARRPTAPGAKLLGMRCRGCRGSGRGGTTTAGDRGGRRVSVPPPRTAGSVRPSRQTSPRREARRR